MLRRTPSLPGHGGQESLSAVMRDKIPGLLLKKHLESRLPYAMPDV
ncbi:hypothetical protein GMO_08980 [Gluconobacter morbifer G707]|uniref:Uncharacterized protein n=1 Tax=Gluconobacter morbifer G707 TaxID=1088869 RepID=G6XHD2_9PROT|nr:hypothetical protein GMO_08980 [Gluconobacter morbifer G707]